MRFFVVLSLVLTLTALRAPSVSCQSGSGRVTVGGHVSKAVFVSVAPGAQLSADKLAVTHSRLNAHSVRLLISISGGGIRRTTVPVLIRSNVGYTLSASANSAGATLRVLCLEGARATGRFVAPDAVEAADKATCGAAAAGVQTGSVDHAVQPISTPSILMTGPRVSLAGTPDAPFNALEVMVLVEVEPRDGQENGSVELTLSAAPDTEVSAASGGAARQ